jgi:hypothetical protein
MFIQLFENSILKDYDYFFILEPDVVAVRNNWMDKVYEEVIHRFHIILLNNKIIDESHLDRVGDLEFG